MQIFTHFLTITGFWSLLTQAAPVIAKPASEAIPGKYIVQLKPDVNANTIAAHYNRVREIHARNIARRGISQQEASGVENKYGFGEFHGYSGSFDSATIEELKSLPEVLQIEQDFKMYTTEIVNQANVGNWGLGSISSRTKGATDYVYDSSAGQGNFNYIIDTGVRATHSEFEGRASIVYNAVNSNNQDNAGHGTHVAGIIGGKTYGVAKKATIASVKVFEGNEGTAATVIKGFDWAINDIVTQNRQNTSVCNLSLGGAGSTTWDNAITAAWKQGVLAVVAAGNDNAPASTRSPARSPETICVGNVQKDDARYGGSSGSNYGPAVDIFAPGTGILSSYYRSDDSNATLSGTSMASPHVAGLVSYIRGLEGASSAEKVKARVLELGTPGRVTDLKDSADKLAYNGNGR